MSEQRHCRWPRVPTVSRSDIYAVAALAGAGVTVAGSSAGFAPTAMTHLVPRVLLRIVAVWRHGNLPRARGSTPNEQSDAKY